MENKPFYAVFKNRQLIELTTSAEKAVRKYVSDASPSSGIFRVMTIDDLAAIFAKSYKKEQDG